MMSPMVFALSPLKQTAEIEKYCYDKCGKRLSSYIRDDIFGNLKTCNQKNCNFEIGRREISKGVCLRRLGIKNRQDIPKSLSV